MRACIRQVESLLEYYSDEFLITEAIDDNRLKNILYPYLDKVKYYHTIEKDIKVILENVYGITGNLYDVEILDEVFAQDLCHYLIGILGSLQGSCFLWYIEKIENPTIVKDEFGNITRLETNEHINFNQVFKMLLFELKRECYRMEGYNLEDKKLLKK